MMNYKLAIFDLDGTILNTLDDLTNSTNHALQANGLPLRSRDEVCRFVGNGIRNLIERAVPSSTPVELIDKVFSDFRAHYKDHAADKTRPYLGIPELLTELRASGCLTAVVSNKADFAVQVLCQQYFPGLFDFVVGEREGIRRKPSPDSVLEVLDKLNVEAKDAVYIGDSDVDIETAKNAEMDVLAVSWGFRQESYLVSCGAKRIVRRPKEILEAIKYE